MPPRRRTSVHTVSQIGKKVAKELAGLQQREDRVEFQNDMEWLQEELKKNPEKLKACKSVVKMDTVDTWNRESDFNPDLAGRALSRVPSKHLTQVFLPSLGGLTVQELAALAKVDTKAPFKILQRLACIPLTMPLGPLNKEQWNNLFTNRVKSLGDTVPEITFDRAFEINWGTSGHFTLEPQPPEGEAASTHVYTEIIFRSIRVPLHDDCITFKGNWTIQQNWNHMEAELVNPSRPKELRFLCRQFFSPDKFLELIPKMELETPKVPENAAVVHRMAIEDVKLQGSAASNENESEVESVVSASARSSADTTASVTRAANAKQSPCKVVCVAGAKPPPKSEMKRSASKAELLSRLEA